MKTFRYSVYLLIGFTVAGIGACLLILLGSLPEIDGVIEFRQLKSPVSITSDRHGIPLIEAETRTDAIRAMGYITARDRLFQMDLMRRKNAGELSEVFGQAGIESDVRARRLGFNRVAKSVRNKLSPLHKHYLQSYADGVNRFIDHAGILPFEFIALNYRPRPWTAEDSILVALGMLDMLTSWAEQEERMLSVMEKSLSRELVEFLTPDTDRFTDQLLDHAETRRPARPIPVAAMSTALAQSLQLLNALQLANAVHLQDVLPGSNAWLVSARKSQNGRAILANDMHLGISVPTIWYRVQVHYGSTQAAGVILPGLPIIVAGSNNHLAWGGTNLSGDFLDLVSLERNLQN